MFQSYQFRFEEVCPDVETLMGFLQIPDLDSYSLVQDTVEHTFSLFTDSQEIVGGYRFCYSRECDGQSTAAPRQRDGAARLENQQPV